MINNHCININEAYNLLSNLDHILQPCILWLKCSLNGHHQKCKSREINN